jgi:uncharacterized membrane protein
MIKWIAKINWLKVLLVGVLYTVISMVMQQVGVLFTMKYYTDPQYSGVWSKLMMPSAGPPPPEFMITSLIMTLASGISIALIYYYLKDMLPKNVMKRTFLFADLLIATSFIFFTLPVYLLFNVPVGLNVSWFAISFISLTATSAVIVKIVGK